MEQTQLSYFMKKRKIRDKLIDNLKEKSIRVTRSNDSKTTIEVPIESVPSQIEKKSTEPDFDVQDDSGKTAKNMKDASEEPIVDPTENTLTSLNLESPEQRAHVKYRALVSSTLAIPLKYHDLWLLYEAVEISAEFCRSRKEHCLYDKIKKSVENTSQRRFELSHLARMKTIMGEILNLEKTKMTEFGIHKWTIKIEFGPFEEGFESNTKTRADYFKDKLLIMTRQHHDTFLKSIGLPVPEPNRSLKRWHPKFLLDLVEDVPEGELPSLVDEKSVNINHILNQYRPQLSTNLRKALEDEVKMTEDSATKDVPNVLKVENTDQTVKEKLMSGIPPSLLEKIRRKEKALAMEAMVKVSTGRMSNSCEKLCQLSEALCTSMLTEKKMAMDLGELSKRLANNTRMLTSASEAKEHLRLLASQVPDWCSICSIDGVEYFRFMTSDIWQAVRQVSDVQKRIRG